MKMDSIAVAGLGLALFAASGSVLSQEPATKLSREELLQLMPGKNVTHVSKAGNTRHWTNEADGSLLASWAPRVIGVGTPGGSAKGTWNISDGGRYCVTIDWRAGAEKWCRFVFRSGNDYAMSATDDPAAEREKFGLK